MLTCWWSSSRAPFRAARHGGDRGRAVRLLGGRRVDLRTAHDLSRYFRDEVERTAEVQFAA